MKKLSRLAALGVCLLTAFAFIGDRPAAAQEGTSTPFTVYYSSNVARVRTSLWNEEASIPTYDVAATNIPAIPENSEIVLVVHAPKGGEGTSAPIKALVLCVKFPGGGGINISNTDVAASDIAANIDGGTAFGALTLTSDSAGAYRLTMPLKVAGVARNIVWGGSGGVPPAPQSTGTLMTALATGTAAQRNIVWGGSGGVPPRSVTVLAVSDNP